MLCEEPRSAV